ncbi:tetratricopeptide repeat protein [Massilia sp. B-10]|nr:tetratricopeptide repeat protein [Massilia sp. B-10]
MLEKLLRQCYSLSRLSLDSYFNEVQLQQTNAMSGGDQLPAMIARDADRFSLTRTFETLLAWLADGRFPWQSLDEVRLADAIMRARARLGDCVGGAISLPLAADLTRLGMLYREQGRQAEALSCFEESLSLRQRVLGEDHPDTRRSRTHLAALLLDAKQAARGQLSPRIAGRRLPAPAWRRPSRYPGGAPVAGRHAGRARRVRARPGAARAHHRRLRTPVRADQHDDARQPGRAGADADPARRILARAWSTSGCSKGANGCWAPSMPIPCVRPSSWPCCSTKWAT